jgi:hypothetical protein
MVFVFLGFVIVILEECLLDVPIPRSRGASVEKSRLFAKPLNLARRLLQKR